MSSEKTGVKLTAKPFKKNVTIHPARTDLFDQRENVGSEKTALGIKLLTCIRDGKVKEANELIDKDADLKQTDRAEWSSMHHAANGGYMDLIMKMQKKGADINVQDSSKETSLHKASRKGHIEVIIALVAYGADVNVPNTNGQYPIELAIKSEKTSAVETLCMLGAEVMLQDWSWTMDEMSQKQKEIVEILLQQHSKASSYKEGSIKFSIAYIEGNHNWKFENLNVEVLMADTPDIFFIYCCKTNEDHSDAMTNIKEKNDVITDVYEVRVWRNERKTLKLKLHVDTVMKFNEKMVFLSPDGKSGRVESIETFTTTADDSKHYSEVIVTLNTKKVPVAFVLGRQVLPEKFTISITEDVTVKPQTEPEAEISIPKGSFEGGGELEVKFMDTTEVNNEEKSEEVLTTNVLDITMSDGQQPKHEIALTMPFHHKMRSTDEVVILATSKEDPSSVDDWEILEAEMDETGKSATFRINHFSIYAGSSKDKVKVDLPGVISALDRSINRKRKVEFFLLTKWVTSETLLMVVEGVPSRKADSRIKCWTKLGYNEKSLKRTKEFSAKSGQRFVLTFSGNLQEVSREESFAMIFQTNGNNFRIFSMCSEDLDRPYGGVMELSTEREVSRHVFVKQPLFFGCCGSKKTLKRENVQESTLLQTLDYEIFKPVEKEPKLDKEKPAKEVSEQALNKLGLFKYKVNTIKHSKLRGNREQ